MKSGKIIPHGVKLQPHELDTVLFFTNLGKDIELIPPSNTPKNQRPDFYMERLAWEIKSPLKDHHRAVERIFYTALCQSDNVIFDLRRLKGNSNKVVTILEKYFNNTRKIRNLIIITKNNSFQRYKK